MIFIRALLDSPWHAHWELGTTRWVLFPLTLLVPILCYQFALEIGGRQFWFFAGLFGWVVPIIASIVMGLAMGDIPEFVVYLMAVSGLSMPLNAVRGRAGG